jgi:hypothetical protein
MNESALTPPGEPKTTPLEGPGSDEYEDFHVFYHETMNQLADRIFTDGTTIDYPTLLMVFSVMKRAAPLGSTASDVLNDHLDDLCEPLLYVLFGHDHL